MQDFEDLEAWKLARSLRNEIFILTKKFPPEEKYRLTDQLVRASRSISANIAEGYGRYHFKDNAKFCRIARGSLIEVLDHLICAFDCSIIDEEILNEYRFKIAQNKKVLNGYIAYLIKRTEEIPSN
ncbi:four helix bundle protein [soil metagenome]